jgi:tetratricopeptide (TPR) repeat protein
MRCTRVLAVVAFLAGIVVGTCAQADRPFVEDQIKKWQRIVARNPKDYETLAAIGGAYGKLGEHAAAIAYFKKAIDANPSYAPAYAGLGSAYGFLQKPDEALAALKKAVSLDPTDAIMQGKLGTTLGKAGQYQEAIVHLKEAVRLAPNLADAHFAEVNALSLLDSQQAARLQRLLDLRR